MEQLTTTINGFTVPATRIAPNLNSPQVTPTRAPVTPINQGQAITPESLKPVPQVNIPVAQVPTPAVAQQTTPTFSNEADRILQESQVEDTRAQQTGNQLSERIFSSLQNLTGEKQALGQAQNAAGVGQFRQQLQDINSQILKKQAELQQDDIRLIQSVQNLEQQKIPIAFITGQQQSVERDSRIARALKSSEIGILNASAIATQGNIALAQDTAQQAVDLKYAPYKEEIALYKAQLEALAPILSKDEKKQAREQELKSTLALKDLEKIESNDKALQNILINASSQNAPADLLNRAKNAKSPSEAAMILGQYAGDFYKTELLKQQISTEKAQRSKIYSDIENKRVALQGTNGVTDAISLQDATKNLKLTESQSKALAFGQRAINADKALRERLQTYDPTTIFSAAGRLLSSDNARAFERDLGDFITAVLRKESGATITEDEFARFIPLYSPQGVLTNQKDVAQTDLKRDASINGLISEAGPASSALAGYKASVGKIAPISTSNPFTQALGQSTTSIPGTSIVSAVNDDGTINFQLPK